MKKQEIGKTHSLPDSSWLMVCQESPDGNGFSLPLHSYHARMKRNYYDPSYIYCA